MSNDAPLVLVFLSAFLHELLILEVYVENRVHLGSWQAYNVKSETSLKLILRLGVFTL